VEPLKQHCRLMNQSTRQPSRTDDVCRIEHFYVRLKEDNHSLFRNGKMLNISYQRFKKFDN
jgi:hypothetical protein